MTESVGDKNSDKDSEKKHKNNRDKERERGMTGWIEMRWEN